MHWNNISMIIQMGGILYEVKHGFEVAVGYMTRPRFNVYKVEGYV